MAGENLHVLGDLRTGAAAHCAALFAERSNTAVGQEVLKLECAVAAPSSGSASHQLTTKEAILTGQAAYGTPALPGQHAVTINNNLLLAMTDVAIYSMSRRASLLTAVREIMGPRASEDSVHWCIVSVVSQFQPYNFNRTIRKIGVRKGKELPVPEVIADHILRFSLAGMETSREKNEGVRK